MKTKKETLKSVKKEFETFKMLARQTVAGLRNPSRRQLLTVDAVDETGKVNGMFVTELITIASLTAGTHERVYMQAYGKSISIYAEKPMPVPMEML